MHFSQNVPPYLSFLSWFSFHYTSPYSIMKTITVSPLESFLRQCFPNHLAAAFPVIGDFHLNHFFLDFKSFIHWPQETFHSEPFLLTIIFDFLNTIALFIASTWTPILYRPLPRVFCFSFKPELQILSTNTLNHSIFFFLLLLFFFLIPVGFP